MEGVTASVCVCMSVLVRFLCKRLLLRNTKGGRKAKKGRTEGQSTKKRRNEGEKK